MSTTSEAPARGGDPIGSMAAGDAGPRQLADSGSGFRPDIQGLRGLAVLVVVLYHAGWGFSGGFVGVDVFFVVSGFVITLMLSNERRTTGSVRAGQFYLRRIRRLLPALATVVTVVLLLNPFLGPVGSVTTTRQTGIAGVLFSANVYLARWTDGYFDLSADYNALVHVWSLSVEEQFYLIFPWLLIGPWWLARRRGKSTHGATMLIAGAAGLSLTLSLVLSYDLVSIGASASQKLAFFGSPARAWEFALGALVAMTAVRAHGWWSDACGLLGVLLLGTAVFTFDVSTTFPGVAVLVPVAAACLLLVSGGDRSSSTHRLLAVPPAQWLGGISYSWYLWHWPFVVFSRALFPRHQWVGIVAAMASLGPAWLSMSRIENPIRRSTDRRSGAALRIGAVCVVIPLLTAVASIQVQDAVSTSLPDLTPHIDAERGCDSDRGSRQDCTWSVQSGATGTLVLVGDSNAGHFSDGILASAEELGLEATLQTRPACPFADLAITGGTSDTAGCRAYYSEQMRYIEADTPDVVVIADSSDRYVEQDMFRLASAPGETWQSTPAAKADIYEDGLRRTVTSITDRGSQVVILHPVPKFGIGPFWDSKTCSAPLLWRVEDSCGLAEPLTSMLARRSSVLDAQEQVATLRGALTLDVASTLCPDSPCRTYRDGHWWWTDGDHISTYASLELESRLTAVLSEALHQ